MRVLGIDPGYATIGYGVIDTNGNKHKVVDYGVITTPKTINGDINLFLNEKQSFKQIVASISGRAV